MPWGSFASSQSDPRLACDLPHCPSSVSWDTVRHVSACGNLSDTSTHILQERERREKNASFLELDIQRGQLNHRAPHHSNPHNLQGSLAAACWASASAVSLCIIAEHGTEPAGIGLSAPRLIGEPKGKKHCHLSPAGGQEREKNSSVSPSWSLD